MPTSSKDEIKFGEPKGGLDDELTLKDAVELKLQPSQIHPVLGEIPDTPPGGRKTDQHGCVCNNIILHIQRSP